PNDRGNRRAWVSDDGHYLLGLSGSGVAQVWDTITRQPVTGLLEHKSGVNGASFSADGRRLLTNTFLSENSMGLWETSGKPLHELYHRARPDNTASVWHLPGGKLAFAMGEPGAATPLRHVSFSPDANRLILLREGAAEIRDANN